MQEWVLTNRSTFFVDIRHRKTRSKELEHSPGITDCVFSQHLCDAYRFSHFYEAISVSISLPYLLIPVLVSDVEKSMSMEIFEERKNSTFFKAAYETENDFYLAYNWLDTHPMLIFPGLEFEHGGFMHSLHVMVVKTDITGISHVEDKDENDIYTEVWLEGGPLRAVSDTSNVLCWMHDLHLDCGGRTYERAVSNMARKVLLHYGWYYNEDHPWLAYWRNPNYG